MDQTLINEGPPFSGPLFYSPKNKSYSAILKLDRKREQSATLAKQVDVRLGLDWGVTNKRWLEGGGVKAEAADFENLDEKILWMKELLIEHFQSHVRNA